MDDAPGITAYHGTPHDFDQFDINKVGTGEGAAAFGHGLYFAEHPDVAQVYRSKLAAPSNQGRVYFDGRPLTDEKGLPGEAWLDRSLDDPETGVHPRDVWHSFQANYGRPEHVLANLRERAEWSRERVETPFYTGRESAAGRAAVDKLSRESAAHDEAAIRWYEKHGHRLSGDFPGRTYKVNINADPEHFLDWDAPLADQHPVVKSALTALMPNRFGFEQGDVPNQVGANAYWALSNYTGSHKAASEALHAQGVPGVRFWDQGSRHTARGTRNYVTFHHDPVEVREKYAEGGEVPPTGWAVPKAARHRVESGTHVVVPVSPAKLDADWQKNRDFYVGPGGEGGVRNSKGTRYGQFGEWLSKTDKPVEMSEPYLGPGGAVEFENGRHRFAYMRDQGATEVPMVVPAEDADKFKERYGNADGGEIEGRQRPYLPIGHFMREENLARHMEGTKTPPVLYHGTQVWEHEGRKLGDIREFNRNASVDIVRRKPSLDTIGHWFDESPHPQTGAGMYAGQAGAVYPAHVRITNPWQPADWNEFVKRAKPDPEGFRQSLIEAGHDGIRLPGAIDNKEQGPVWVAFHPSQIKSAVGNRGTFDPEDPDITKAGGGEVEGAVNPADEPPTPANTETQSRVGQVRFDQAKGAGSVPDNENVNYLGFTAMMKPSKFLSLSHKLEPDERPGRIEALRDHVAAGNAIGSPFLSVNLDDEDEGFGKVHRHDGRHRMMAIQELQGDTPVPVHIFGRQGTRARHLSPESIDKVRKRMVTQRSSRESNDNFEDAFHLGRVLPGGRSGRAGGGEVSDPTGGPPPTQPNAQGLYSQGARAAMALGQTKGTGSQMLASLKGVKPEEMKWAGVQGSLGGEPSVTKHDIAERFQGALPVIDETLLGGRPRYSVVSKDARRIFQIGQPSRLFEDRADAEAEQARRQQVKQMGLIDVSQAHHDIVEQPEGGPPRYAQYAIPGGKNYRELLLGLNEPYDKDYRSAHWHQPNVLAHLRMSDRQGQQGEKLLHLEELQSDWGQEGRQKGFRDQVKIADAKRRMRDADDAKERLHTEFAESGRRDSEYLKDVERRFDELTHQHREARDDLWENEDAVPAAPYVTKTEGWTDLGLKRLLHEAAKGDYDKVVWTPGDVHADRYNLDSGKGMRGYYDNILPKRMLALAREHDPSATLDGTYLDPTVMGDEAHRFATKPFPGLAITPQMRESILRNGFKAYAHGGLARAEGGFVARPKGWNAASDEVSAITRPDHFYRGMTKAEFDATVGKGQGVGSAQHYSTPGEGTSFSHDAGDAESYVNFGRDDPRKTGKPNYLVEVRGDEGLKQDRDGYFKAAASIHPDRISRVWEMSHDNGAVVATPFRAQRAEGGPLLFHSNLHGHHQPHVPHAAHHAVHHLHVGPIHSAVAGRTDHLPMHVPSGSYVLPADVVAGFGESNTTAGFKTMRRLFGGMPYGQSGGPYGQGSGPYGEALQGESRGGRAAGEPDKGVPIVAAGGEYVLSPEQVRAVGKGDPDLGCRVLDEFVKRSRAKHIQTLRGLPGPAKD